MKLAIIILMFLFLGAFFIISQENLALKNPENIDKFVSQYTSWVSGTFANFGKFTGYILKLEWLPENKTE